LTKGNGGLVAKGAPVRLYWEAEKGGVSCDPWAAYSGGAEAAGPVPGGPGGGAGRHPAGHLQMGEGSFP